MTRIEELEQQIKVATEELDSISWQVATCSYCGNEISTYGKYSPAHGCKVEVYNCKCQVYDLENSEVIFKRVLKKTR